MGAPEVRPLQGGQVMQAELREPLASPPQAVVLPRAALQEAKRQEHPRKPAVLPGLQVSPLAAQPQVAEAQRAQRDTLRRSARLPKPRSAWAARRRKFLCARPA